MSSIDVADASRPARGGRITEILVVICGSVAALWALAPPGSFPVGWDVWWNLHVARVFAESGFPDVLPDAGYTQLARDYADRQLLFHALIAVFGGEELDGEHVPYFLAGFGLALAITVIAAARTLGARASLLPALFLWGLSSTALFRATALRDMLLALPFLLLLLARLGSCVERVTQRDAVVLASIALLFSWSHGAPALLVVLVALVALGRRFDGGRALLLQTTWPVLLGVALALLLRPNPRGALELFWTLNVEMPWAAMTGRLPIQPSEFSALPIASWFRQSWPLALASVGIALAGRRAALPWRVALPALACTIGSLFGARLLELAVPLTVLGLLLAWPRRRGASMVAVALAFACGANAIWRAVPSCEANRFVAARELGRTLAKDARPGDTVFVADWGLSSPLAFWTRGKGLVFTGVTDPVLMLHEEPELFELWWRIKSARDPKAASTIRERFGARFIAIDAADRAPGRPAGETSVAIWRSLRELEAGGRGVRTSTFASPPGKQALVKALLLYEIGAR